MLEDVLRRGEFKTALNNLLMRGDPHLGLLPLPLLPPKRACVVVVLLRGRLGSGLLCAFLKRNRASEVDFTVLVDECCCPTFARRCAVTRVAVAGSTVLLDPAPIRNGTIKPGEGWAASEEDILAQCLQSSPCRRRRRRRVRARCHRLLLVKQS